MQSITFFGRSPCFEEVFFSVVASYCCFRWVLLENSILLSLVMILPWKSSVASLIASDDQRRTLINLIGSDVQRLLDQAQYKENLVVQIEGNLCEKD